jgi:hypothetical protein
MRFALIFAVLLAGCSSIASNMPSPEQLSAAAKDKNASAVCVVVTGPWGKGTTTYVNVDKTAITAGEVTVGDDCKVTVTNSKPNPVGR